MPPLSGRKAQPGKPAVPLRAASGNESSIARVGKAVQSLRRGDPVAISGAGGAITVIAVESASDARIAKLRKLGVPRLILSHARARTLKIRLYTPDIVAIALGKNIRARDLRSIADPTNDMSTPMKGPFEALRQPMPDACRAGVKLAKLAGLLPAVLAVRKTIAGATAVKSADIEGYDSDLAGALEIITRAHVPLEGAEQTEIVAFRPADSGPEHYAIIINSPSTSKPVLTRLHSECFTGDLLGSLKCDCGPQLRGAIRAISRKGGGILLYLAQEGRGIGLINKLRAYKLQDQGFDTIEANERLGFEADERLYVIAARMLQLLGFKSVRLMTNNPLKVRALKDAGIRIVARVPHKFPANVHNRAYLKTKADKAGHLF